MANVLLKLEELLEGIVLSSIAEAADEKDIQLSTAKSIKSDKRPLKAGDDDEDVNEAEGDDEGAEEDDSGGDMSKRPVEIPEKLPAAITIDMIIDGIDAIRSARSLKKPEVREEFEEYFNSLTSDEKIALLAFVYGIAETLIGDAPGRGLDPGEEPYNVEISSDPDQSQKPSTTPVSVPKEKSASDGADTPIVVGG